MLAVASLKMLQSKNLFGTTSHSGSIASDGYCAKMEFILMHCCSDYYSPIFSLRPSVICDHKMRILIFCKSLIRLRSKNLPHPIHDKHYSDEFRPRPWRTDFRVIISGWPPEGKNANGRKEQGKELDFASTSDLWTNRYIFQCFNSLVFY